MMSMLANAGADLVTAEVSELTGVLVEVVIAAAAMIMVVLAAGLALKAAKAVMGDEGPSSNGPASQWRDDVRAEMRHNMRDRGNSTDTVYMPDGRATSAGSSGELAGVYDRGGPRSKSSYRG